jgi:hypothetical protein
MLERLIDVLIEFVGLFQVFFYVDHYEQAVVLRAGRYHRTVAPGAHYILPFAVEDVISTNVKPEPVYLDTQTVHTLDGYVVHIQVGYVYAVTVPKTFLLDFEDTEDTISMLLSGLVAQTIQQTKWADLQTPGWLTNLKRRANKKARKRGALISELVIQDLASGEANRLWVEGVDIG